jgi:hypothetical protein
MKRKREKTNICNFLRTIGVISITLLVLTTGSTAFASHQARTTISTSAYPIYMTTDDCIHSSTTIFTIEDPPVDFEVVDAEPFDGYGDNGPYSTFNDVLLGTLGECRSMAEFDIQPFSIPPGEFINSATFEVIITQINISGLGVNGETPESVAVDGYVGNGVAELSDFEAGDGNILDSLDTPDPQIGQVLSFDVTSFVIDLVNAQEQFVGLTVRAETFGGLWVTENGEYPKLTIETTPIPEPDLNCDGSLSWTDVKPGATVYAELSIENIGEDESFLDWQIESYPPWGTWTFTPSSGVALPKGSAQVVNVTIIAPSEKPAEFTGNVTIINIENSTDYCVIPVYLKTPLDNNLVLQNFFQRLFERFPHAFPMLRHLLRY